MLLMGMCRCLPVCRRRADDALVPGSLAMVALVGALLLSAAGSSVARFKVAEGTFNVEYADPYFLVGRAQVCLLPLRWNSSRPSQRSPFAS